MDLIIHHLMKNGCYKKAAKMTPKGIIVHSTAAINKSITRYVDAAGLGKVSSLHWNVGNLSKCVTYMIGESSTMKKVVCVETLPPTYKPWGCGKGTKGSYNNTHIQFEICEGADEDKAYFDAAYETALDLCADLCKKYKIPGDKVIDHREAHAAGYASNHGDVSSKDAYFTRHGKSMKQFRADLEKRLKEPAAVSEEASVPFKVRASSARIYKNASGTTTSKTCSGVFTIVEISGKYGRLKSGAGWLDLEKVSKL